MRLALVVAAAALLLAGCATGAGDYPVTPVEQVTAAPITAAPVVPAVPVPGVPVLVTIPKLGASDDIVPVGIAADGSMEVPDVLMSGWYRLGVKPGEKGAAVVIGHVDFKGVPGQLGRIGELKPGDLVVVKDSAGVERTFVTDKVTQIPKSQYMARTVPLVFGDVPGAELRIVTCSGVVINHEYQSNTILSAHLLA